MNLVKIEGKVVSRFDGRKRLDTREFDMSQMPGDHRRAHVEHIRQHGFAGYDKEDEAAASPPEFHVFDHIVQDLEEGIVKMSPRVIEQ